MVNVKKDYSAYCWLVLVALFISSVIYGLATFGTVSVLVTVWVEKFNISTDQVSWAPAIQGGTMFLSGPLLTVILQQIGAWKTQLIGGVFLCGASVATAFATEFWHAVLSYSLLQGFSAGVLQMATTDIVSVYFDKRQDKVYAGLMTSFFVGLLIGPTFTEALIQAISYKYALIVQAGIYLLIIPTAIIYRGPCCGSDDDGESSASTDGGKQGEANEGYDTDSMDKEESKTEKTPIRRPARRAESLSISSGRVSYGSIKRKTHTGVYTKRKEIHSTLDESTAGAIEPRDMRQVSIVERSHVNLREVDDSESESKSGVRETLRSHLYVLKQPLFILFMIFFMCLSVGENTFFGLAADYTVTKGVLDLPQAALGMTFTGVGTVIGSLVVAVLSNWEFDRTLLMITSGLLMGVANILIPTGDSQPVLYVLFIIFGINDGFYVSGIASWIFERFNHPDYLIIRMSYVYFMIGVGSLFGPIVAGQFSKAVSFDGVFFFLGAFPLTAALMLVPYWIKLKVDQCRQPKDTEEQNSS